MIKAFGVAVKELADIGWRGVQALNTRLPEGAALIPEWAPGPLPKSRERGAPPLGWPRETDSLCPRCVLEARREILRGTRDFAELLDGHVGEIKARILEEDGQLLMRKRCERHGAFEEILSIDPRFTRITEERYPGRDYRTSGDELVHAHGASAIRYGRGGVLNVDLTNRCNMMCNPCFTDANQVGHVHELTLDEIKQILDDSMSFKPRRQMSVQFSGGEPTLSPHFLEACRYAKSLGYFSVQVATNGVRFALEPDFAPAAREAGLDLAYFQFDGVTNEANSHRHVTNLFDVKLKAIDAMHAVGFDLIPVTTVVRTLSDQQVGPILDFVIANANKFGGVSFQPVSFTGRDEQISDADRKRLRYTTSHLAHDLARHSSGRIDPYRDWFPLSAIGSFTALSDYLREAEAPKRFGSLSCMCHPDCGSSFLLIVNPATRVWSTVTQFFDLEQFMRDLDVVSDTARGRWLSIAQVIVSFVRNYDERKAPPGLTLQKFANLFFKDKMGAAFGGRKFDPEWTLLWVGGMWFQDLWTYDFRRTEACAVPCGTQEGEISFCAYNTGIGWRQIVESIHAAGKTADWFEACGRHTIYAGDRPIDLGTTRRLPLIDGRAMATEGP
jgi:hypothetical protein